jgi:hypothetical protein
MESLHSKPLDYKTEGHLEPLSSITRAHGCLCPQPGVVPLGIGTLKGMRAKMSSANPEHPSAERLHLRAGSLLFSELADSCEGRQLVQRGQGRSTDHLHAHIALAEVWRPKVFSSAGASMRRAARKSA